MVLSIDSIIAFVQANPIRSIILGYGSIHLAFRWTYTLLGKAFKSLLERSKKILFRNPNIPQEKKVFLSEELDSIGAKTSPFSTSPVDKLKAIKREAEIYKPLIKKREDYLDLT